MKLDTPTAVLVGSALVALAVFIAAHHQRYAIVQTGGLNDGFVAMRVDRKTGKADACFMSKGDDLSYSNQSYEIACDGIQRRHR